MYLIDTSVWIDSFRQIDNPSSQFFKSLIAERAPFGITGAIFQEVLQGARTPRDYASLKTYLGSLPFYHPSDPVETYAEAGGIYLLCRTKGFTVRSTLDCLIARIAIEYELVLVHHDRDFAAMATVLPDLKTAPPLRPD